MCRVQNGSLNSDSVSEFPLSDLTAIFQPSKEPPEPELSELTTEAKTEAEILNEEDPVGLKTQPQVRPLNCPPRFFYSRLTNIGTWSYWSHVTACLVVG